MPASATLPPLGRLANVEPRAIWAHEALHFTPWLTQPDNIALLGEAIGIQIEPEATEVSVGGFSADIVARDLFDGTRILIENQLEPTDHTHLGQLLTYLAGLEARTVVWISRKLRDEHRAAMEWLNACTDDRFRFFAVEIELWRIGESMPAPRFSVLVKPNDWVRRERAQLRASEPTEDGARALGYWSAFAAWLGANAPEIQRESPSRTRTMWLTLPQDGLVVSVNRTISGLIAFVRPANRASATAAFEAAQAALIACEERLRTALGQSASRSKDGGVAARRSCDVDNEADWPAQFAWVLDQYRRLAGALANLTPG
jgi:hypothetical protein